ncbi:MAG: hypothetical protein AAF194_08040 [Pseudomonadota bacterium]
MPLLSGTAILVSSIGLFLLSSSLMAVGLMRALQGLGSSLLNTAGMGMLAKAILFTTQTDVLIGAAVQAYSKDEERGTALGIALAG